MYTTIIAILVVAGLVLFALGGFVIKFAYQHQKLPRKITAAVVSVWVIVAMTIIALMMHNGRIKETAEQVADAQGKANEAIRLKHEIKDNLTEAKAAVKAVAEVPDEIKELRLQIEQGRTNSGLAHKELADGYTDLAKRIGAIENQINQPRLLPTDGQVLQPPALQIPQPKIIYVQVTNEATLQPNNSKLESAVTKLSEQVTKLDGRLGKMEKHVEASDEKLNKTLINMSGNRFADRVTVNTTLLSPKPFFRTAAIWADSGQKNITYTVKFRMLKTVDERDAEAFIKRVIVKFNSGHGGKHYAYQSPVQERTQADFSNDFHHEFARMVEREARWAGVLFIESATYLVAGQASNGGAAKSDAPPLVIAQ